MLNLFGPAARAPLLLNAGSTTSFCADISNSFFDGLGSGAGAEVVVATNADYTLPQQTFPIGSAADLGTYLANRGNTFGGSLPPAAFEVPGPFFPPTTACP